MSIRENRVGEGWDGPRPTLPAHEGRALGGRWTILRALGSGGTASVYEAVHRNGRRVAVKLLHPALASNPSVKRRFQSEGYAANRVPHPNVVAILDDGEEPDGTVYLVMELLEGRSLAAYLKEDEALPADVIASAAMAVLDVLAVAHDSGVVHRDVKPANVFMTREGRFKLLDFGAAQTRETATDSTITQSGFSVGTPAFMAPEQAAGRSQEIDALTDVWAVGATMFQLLTRRLVHDEASARAALIASATTPAPPVRSISAHVPPEIAHVVDRALAFDRSERWPNARSMRRALARACPDALVEADNRALGSGSEPETADHDSPYTAPTRVRPARLAALVLLGVAVSLVGAWTMHAAANRKVPPSGVTRSTLSKAIAQPDPRLAIAPEAPAVGSIMPEPALTLDLHASIAARPVARPGVMPRPRPGLPVDVRESEDALLARRK